MCDAHVSRSRPNRGDSQVYLLSPRKPAPLCLTAALDGPRREGATRVGMRWRAQAVYPARGTHSAPFPGSAPSRYGSTESSLCTMAAAVSGRTAAAKLGLDSVLRTPRAGVYGGWRAETPQPGSEINRVCNKGTQLYALLIDTLPLRHTAALYTNNNGCEGTHT